MSLAHKACIITGAGRGIGRAIAQRLTGAGANVLVAARSAVELEATVALCGNGGRCVAQPTNMARPEDVDALIARCTEEFGGLDVLINNAGVAPLSTIEEMNDAMFTDLVAVNIHSVFFACRAAWPLLKQSKGTIVNISSLAAVDPFLGFAAYGATKAWVNTFTRGRADEGRPLGIKVFALGPGAVETQALRTPFPDFPAEQALQPDDVAAMVEWLLDERCQYASGQTIYIRK
jgi:meso-butanediol dehydrogenase/(S,S)-butanediol dehydrogenase/diacetyl reductase